MKISMSTIVSVEPLEWEHKTFGPHPKAPEGEAILVDVEYFDSYEDAEERDYDFFYDQLLDKNELVMPIAYCSSKGDTGIMWGHHIFQVLRDLGNRVVPVWMAPKHLLNAKSYRFIRKLSYPRYEKKLGGIVLVRESRKGPKVLLLKGPDGKWDIPKGHVESGEGFLEGAVRECYEETGIDAQVDAATFMDLPTNTKLFRIYLGETLEPYPKLSDEHLDYKWAKPAAAAKKLSFPQLKQAVEVLATKHPSYQSNPIGDYVSLAEVFDEYPDDREMIWNYVSPADWEDASFKIVEVNPVEIAETFKVDSSNTVMEAYRDYAEDWQRKLIRDMRGNLDEIMDEPIVISGKTLVDGHHRVIAMALEGIESITAIDLEQEL